MKGKRSKWGFGVVGAVAALTLGVIGVAGAAGSTTATPTPGASAQAGQAHVPDGDGGGHRGPGHHGGFGGIGDIPEALATLTGSDAATIMQQRAAGTSFLEIAKAKGITEAQVIAAVTKLETAELDAAVKSGEITEAQRTQYLAALPASIKQALTDTSAMPAHGPGGRDGDGPTGSGTTAAPATGATTQTTYQTY
jgi:hypothetical protein